MHPSGFEKAAERENEIWDLSHEFMENCTHFDLAKMYTNLLLENGDLMDRVKELDESESELALELIDLEAHVQVLKESIWYKIYKFFNK